MPPKTLAGYQLDHLLGRGAMGSIYRAVRLADGQPVAIKVLHRRLAVDPEVIARFERELELTSRAVHPHLVRFLDHGQGGDGTLFLVMELLSGRPLSTIIHMEAPVAPARVANIARQTLEGLAAAHAVGVVHRDLKPENIMLLKDDAGIDHVKVFDFGLSFQSDNLPGDARLTAMDMRIGTPAYMAPEYISEGELDPRSDQYSMGIVLYELLSGRMPFEGPAYALMHHHLHSAPPLLGGLCHAPSALTRAIHRLLNKDPSARFSDASAAAAAFAAVLGL